MPNHKSCAKRMKTSEKERLRNRKYRTILRTAIRNLRLETSKDAASKKFKEVATIIDKAASYGIIHQNNAARNKSRLSHFVAKLS